MCCLRRRYRGRAGRGRLAVRDGCRCVRRLLARGNGGRLRRCRRGNLAKPIVDAQVASDGTARRQIERDRIEKQFCLRDPHVRFTIDAGHVHILVAVAHVVQLGTTRHQVALGAVRAGRQCLGIGLAPARIVPLKKSGLFLRFLRRRIAGVAGNVQVEHALGQPRKAAQHGDLRHLKIALHLHIPGRVVEALHARVCVQVRTLAGVEGHAFDGDQLAAKLRPHVEPRLCHRHLLHARAQIADADRQAVMV